MHKASLFYWEERRSSPYFLFFDIRTSVLISYKKEIQIDFPPQFHEKHREINGFSLFVKGRVSSMPRAILTCFTRSIASCVWLRPKVGRVCDTLPSLDSYPPAKNTKKSNFKTLKNWESRIWPQILLLMAPNFSSSIIRFFLAPPKFVINLEFTIKGARI